jgi:hypothetical protein
MRFAARFPRIVCSISPGRAHAAAGVWRARLSALGTTGRRCRGRVMEAGRAGAGGVLARFAARTYQTLWERQRA